MNNLRSPNGSIAEMGEGGGVDREALLIGHTQHDKSSIATLHKIKSAN